MNLSISELFRYLKYKFSKALYEEQTRDLAKLEVKRNGYKFPCSSDNCLVRAACTRPCDKLVMDDEGVKELFLKYNACPDCGSEAFYEGPSGGMATNVQCQGCGHWYNMGLPMFIQRIHVSDGRFYE